LQLVLILTYIDNVPYSLVPGLSKKFVYFFTEFVLDGAFKVMKISSRDRAVHVENSSRLFFDTSGQPIPAVNSCPSNLFQLSADESQSEMYRRVKVSLDSIS
jgi:hypothetical protein